ncbi:transketolase [Usitatibacter palustris]|uniref:Transketolase n=1 Tax=Usitatibacter palustris TaxID=2732487 RepID=A0A6M4HD11_9PROT|nr:transketolase [Usitatibacter palustris]QJR16433.1 Transketolase 1 [Usitatibacter palustris]
MPDTPVLPASHADLVNAIRALAMDAVQAANSGHPGMPMGMAEISEVLWRKFLRHNPANPAWVDRDRFVLSNGHGSMLQYALLHLSGYDLPMEQIRAFRKLHSKTPGHPEHGLTPGVETTTGPLGQGLANAVGFALAEKLLAADFNRPGHAIVDHHTYVFVGDGCLMEGISHEACSLAGTLGLGKLIALYDDNGISIDGKVEGWFRDNTPMRFAAYGWNVIPNVDGHDPRALEAAIAEAREETSKPTLICCKTVIGKGSPSKAGTDAVHGAALGDKEVAATREAIGWKHAPFEIPKAVYEGWDARGKGATLEQEWNARFAAYEKAHPEAAKAFRERMSGKLPASWAGAVESLIAKANEKGETVATRKASQLAIEALAPHLPGFLGGSADLTGSNLTNWSGTKAITDKQAGNYVYFGVREFGMAAAGNGIALHGGFIPYSGTFLTFSDYSRNALRMASLMKLRNIFVFTHDSIGLGEDGPTHQSVEHVASLRLIPGMDVWRPCDTVETAVAWAMAIERHDGPSSLALSRQNSPFVKRSPEAIAAIRRGGYVISEASGTAKAIIIATGTEMQIALAAQKVLAESGIPVRVVSMPCTSLFDRQDAAWRASVLTKGVPRVSIEAGVTDFWRKYVGLEGAAVGVDRFGESAPAADVYKFLGVDTEHLVAAVRSVA